MYRGDRQFRYNGLTPKEKENLKAKEDNEKAERKANRSGAEAFATGAIKGILGIPLDPKKTSL